MDEIVELQVKNLIGRWSRLVGIEMLQLVGIDYRSHRLHEVVDDVD